MIHASLSKGWNAFIGRWGVLVLASAMFLAAVAPIGWMAYLIGSSAQEMAKLQLDMNHQGGQASVEESQELLGKLLASLVPCCCGGCGDFAFTIFLMAPVAAGATIAGAQAAAGRPAAAHLSAGFRRYGAVLWVGTLCIVVGGGVVVMASAIASAGARMGVTAAAEVARDRAGAGAERIVWIAVALVVVSMIWLSARLWLALYRLVDPVRPRIGARESLKWSWTTTAGAVQWRILAVLLILGVVVGVLQIPSEWLAAQDSLAMQATGWSVSIALALFLWLPWVLAVSGALYEQLASGAAAATLGEGQSTQAQ